MPASVAIGFPTSERRCNRTLAPASSPDAILPAMSRSQAIALFRAAFGVVILAAIGTQLSDLAGKGVLDPLHYFSYFTIQSNLIACAVLLIGAARWRAPRSLGWELVRGAAVVYMSVTGIVFTLLLSGTDVDTAIPWVNTVVHELIPIVIVVDWLVDSPTMRLTLRQGVLWLSYPAVWLVYTLVKGPIVGKYPYPFLDPANGGYGTVAVYCVAILVVMALVCWATVVLGNAVSPRGRAPDATA